MAGAPSVSADCNVTHPGCPQFLAPIKALFQYAAVKFLMYVRD